MTRYRIKAGEEYVWSAFDDKQFVQGLREYSYFPKQDDTEMLRSMAASFCDWTGKPIRYSSVSDFVTDSVRHGCLEIVG